MSKFKAEFTLKQHTPIIHFQSNQSGATLRATELKPKFDRFLLKYAKDIPYIENANKHKSIDYKVKIESIGSIEKSLPNKFLYFANASIKENSKKIHMLKANSIKVEFFSYNEEIINSIKKYFNDFMLITNFGARSNKGYGSFSKQDANTKEILKKYFPIVFKLKNVDIKKWEDKVDNAHKLLKSGINFKTYHKSLLFQYMCTKRIRWEKRKIKEEFKNLAQGKPPIDCDIKGEYRYVRAMLGVAGINEYKGKQIVSIDGGEIERFASPMCYKIIDNNIYLLGDRSYEKIMNKTFKFKYGGKSFELKTPKKDEFDLLEFLQFVQKREKFIEEIRL